jgi:ethanolamine ammonia-lyase large subunit
LVFSRGGLRGRGAIFHFCAAVFGYGDASFQASAAAYSMPSFARTVGSHVYRFVDLKSVMACASPLRSGDELAGIAARTEQERVAARMVLADLPLRTFLDEALVPYEADEVTRLIVDSHDAAAFAAVASFTVGGLRDWLLSYAADGNALARLAPGLTPEMAAAVSKLMRTQDLVAVASKCEVMSAFRSTLGARGCLSSRLQPNHPTDDVLGVMASTIDGLRFGIGDAVIGINPASDSIDACVTLLRFLDELRLRFDIPTQSCVLSHVTTSIAAIERGAPVDLVFQSIAGSELANAGFGVTLAMLAEAQDAAHTLKRGSVGDNVMYFESGQGSALSASAHHGVDQQTMEARSYAVARAFRPLLHNSVVGFIGPEYLYDAKQIIRAGLEDHFCGKLLGLPMGIDVCYTNHAEADQDDMDVLMTLLAVAGVNFLIAVPGADDIMLGYQSLAYHDVLGLRQLFKRRPAPEFDEWLKRMGMLDGQGRLPPLQMSGPSMQRLLAQSA